MRGKAAELYDDVGVKLGSWAITVPTGAVTTIAARSNTAGHVLAAQWTNATSKAQLRYLAAQFVLTTAFGAAQEVGLEAFVARTYTGAHTGGTPVTLSGSNQKLRAGQPTSLWTDMRVAGAGALTAVTATLDNVPFASCSGWAGAVGVIVAKTVLYDAKTLIDPMTGAPLYSPIVFGANEGLVLANSVLMGASGVGRWQFQIEWDEVTP